MIGSAPHTGSGLSNWFLGGDSIVPPAVAISLLLLVVVCVTLGLLIVERRRRKRQAAGHVPADTSLRDEVIERLLKALPDAHITDKEPAAFRLSCGGTGDEPMLVVTTRLQQALASQPDQAESIKEHFVQNLLQMLQMAETASFEWKDASRYIVPQLVSSSDSQSVRFPLGHGLEVQLALALPTRLLPVDQGSLERWNKTSEEALERALLNLDLRSGPDVVQRMRHESGQPVFVCEKGDTLDASRILLTDLWHDMASEADSDLLIAVPGRDFLIAFPADDESLVDQLRDRIIEDWQGDPHPLTWKFFKLEDDSIVPHEIHFH